MSGWYTWKDWNCKTPPTFALFAFGTFVTRELGVLAIQAF